jgi:hypothetical protein
MNIQFTHPISDTKIWKGELEVSANVDGMDCEIIRIMYVDKNGCKANVTDLIIEWAGELYEKCEEMAINDARNLRHPEDEDWTMAQQFRDELNDEIKRAI